jgi:hypothetical protein
LDDWLTRRCYRSIANVTMKNCCFGPDFPPQNGYPADVNIKLATTPEEMRRWAAQWRDRHRAGGSQAR